MTVLFYPSCESSVSCDCDGVGVRRRGGGGGDGEGEGESEEVGVGSVSVAGGGGLGRHYSSMESGFDADNEEDVSVWYLTPEPSPNDFPPPNAAISQLMPTP